MKYLSDPSTPTCSPVQMMKTETQGPFTNLVIPQNSQLLSLTISQTKLTKTTLMDHFMNIYTTFIPDHLKTHSAPKQAKSSPTFSRAPEISLEPPKLSQNSSPVDNTLKLESAFMKLSGEQHHIYTTPIWVDGCPERSHNDRIVTITSEEHP